MLVVSSARSGCEGGARRHFCSASSAAEAPQTAQSSGAESEAFRSGSGLRCAPNLIKCEVQGLTYHSSAYCARQQPDAVGFVSDVLGVCCTFTPLAGFKIACCSSPANWKNDLTHFGKHRPGVRSAMKSRQTCKPDSSTVAGQLLTVRPGVVPGSDEIPACCD